MPSKTLPFLISTGIALMINTAVSAETRKLEFPQASPACTVKQRVGLTDVEITYSRPGVKDRVIFGDVVPFGKVWRTGANAATKLTFSTPVKLNGNKVEAGTYALMTIPEKDEWTVIVNKPADWGHYKYDEKADVLQFKVTPASLSKRLDAFTIEFDEIRDQSSNLILAWDKTKVPIKLEVEYVDALTEEIDKVMSSDEPNKPYFQAAAFYYNNNKDPKKAIEWMDKALGERVTFFMMHLKAKILDRLGDRKAALENAEGSLKLSKEANDYAYIKLNEELIKKLK